MRLRSVLLAGVCALPFGMGFAPAPQPAPPAATASTCGCPPVLEMQGPTNPDGSANRDSLKIKARFPGRHLPYKVRVKGTTDLANLSGGGNWISRNRYTHTRQTLELVATRESVVIKECSYGSDGALLPANIPCAPEFYSLSMVSGANSITYTWQLTGQDGVANYRIERRQNGGTFATVATVQVVTRLDDQGFYTYTYAEDNLPSGQYEYRVVAVCTSGQLFPMPNETVNL